jgi:hypothetical protein
MNSIREIYKIGKGLSSNHTVVISSVLLRKDLVIDPLIDSVI